jgi:acyl-CoA synthetase (AMP-forming)/AMP-acid ligase II
MTSIPAVMAVPAERVGDEPAVIEGSIALTYGELSAAARSFGAACAAWGVEVCDRVAIWCPNSLEWIVAALGVFHAGGVLVPVNTRFKGAEAAEILGRSRARILVTTTEFLGTDYVGMLRRAARDLPDLRVIVVTRGPDAEEAVGWEAFLERAGSVSVAEVDQRARALGPGDPSDILFTSGTTGVPKGVVQTHGRTLHVAIDWARMTGLRRGDRYLMVNPYFHMFGLKAGILACVAVGATMVPHAVFNVDEVLARVSRERITVLPGPPTLYQAILDHEGRDRFDLSSLRVAVTGAADIPVELIERIRSDLPFSRVITGYGLTEAGTATATGPHDPPDVVASTVGRARPGFEVRAVDEAGRPVPAGEVGEVLLRGPSVMREYLDDPAATAAAFTSDGWLRTGDLGVLDDAGYLRIVGRKKDMFIVGGFNAYPAEIESFLLQHPDIRQAAVIGIPDRRLGEVGMAFVVTRPGASLNEADLIAWCRDRMANYKVPRVVEFVHELPVNAMGKVEKEVLRARAAERGERGSGW